MVRDDVLCRCPSETAGQGTSGARDQGSHERALTTACASHRPHVGERTSGAATMEIDDRDVLQRYIAQDGPRFET